MMVRTLIQALGASLPRKTSRKPIVVDNAAYRFASLLGVHPVLRKRVEWIR